ncbi:SdiA-regulated domain-containing protein [Xanthomarina spongicola]|uniref:SdiA-regulated protein n=1 Tax=Xanthomarina spongicola TaxID=570520 RepID=A0A316DLM7_9FLAO|nr:SdiA-regulated domain-containing protein [Xanthomarina spongicola]PWK19034.1 hypothetical protein LX78_01512 [Xanthomarina spongicola]
MKFLPLCTLALILTLTSCKSDGLNTIASLPLSLKEVSAAEKTPFSNLIWMIEDSRNNNTLFGLNESGEVIKELHITNVVNNDWEDLTSDSIGNIYIGDFGNNKKERTSYYIYKVKKPNENSHNTTAEKITFRLPVKMKQENFEAFFIYNNHFYIFNKENKKGRMYKVPNLIGEHEAELVTEFRLNDKNNKITSADISDDGKTVVLLNKDKMWKISNFEGDDFFNGTIESIDFNHLTQKEGICFKDKQTIYITDERIGIIGGKIYTFNLSN